MIYYDASIFENVETEKITSFEIGTGYKMVSRMIEANMNYYYTLWQDRAFDRDVDIKDINGNTIETIHYLLQGVDALHSGIELSTTVRPHNMFALKAGLHLANWNGRMTSMPPTVRKIIRAKPRKPGCISPV